MSKTRTLRELEGALAELHEGKSWPSPAQPGEKINICQPSPLADQNSTACRPRIHLGSSTASHPALSSAPDSTTPNFF